jgi:hypothetical protein
LEYYLISSFKRAQQLSDLESFKMLQNAANRIEAQKKTIKCLRMEQVLNYEFNPVFSDHAERLRVFFKNHLHRLLRVYGMNIYKWDPDAHGYLLEDLENLAFNSDSLSSLESHLNELSDQPILIVELMGQPLIHLDVISVPHTIWPGLLTTYLDVFQSLAQKFVQFAKKDVNSLVPTLSLEVLGNLERVMSYLFNGDLRKLGRTAISELSLLPWLEEHSFPLFTVDLYDFESLPSIKPNIWPKTKRTSFSNLAIHIQLIEFCIRRSFT